MFRYDPEDPELQAPPKIFHRHQRSLERAMEREVKRYKDKDVLTEIAKEAVRFAANRVVVGF